MYGNRYKSDFFLIQGLLLRSHDIFFYCFQTLPPFCPIKHFQKVLRRSGENCISWSAETNAPTRTHMYAHVRPPTRTQWNVWYCVIYNSSNNVH